MDDYPYDLGRHSFPASTESAEAQLWFDRGLTWTYGFNHDEAVACFCRALEADPLFAMAQWGVAYASGPNYNMPWSLFDDSGRAKALGRARNATVQAQILATRPGANVTAAERMLIEALSARYPQSAPLESPDDMEAWNRDFADRMRLCHKAHPDISDIRAVFAESLLNLTPWKMWDLATGTPSPGAATEEALEVLESGLSAATGMRHPGLLHMYVHLMEMSPEPERALGAADALRELAPDAGHLVHMPTHIDVLCGNYADVVRWNRRAVAADRKYLEREGAFNVYSGYRMHDYHFIVYGAMFQGRFAPAMQAVREMQTTIPREFLEIESPPMADYFEAYLALEPHVLVRFGRWRDCIELPMPEDPELRCSLAAYSLYARALGHAALGDVGAAEREERAFLDAADRVPPSRVLHNNKVRDALGIAAEMLRGEILYRKGETEEAFRSLRNAVSLEDGLPYDEPWGWMQPVRHALGALLLEQGRTEEAEIAYREDLGLGGQASRATVHPDNVWALRGLHDCLEARGDTAELRLVRQRLDLALARADTDVAASCMCARVALDAVA